MAKNNLIKNLYITTFVSIAFLFLGGKIMTNKFILSSNSFKNNEKMPLIHAYTKFSPEAKNQSPELRWENAPKKTKSFVIICNDPDAVGGDFIHWTIYNLPASATKIYSKVPKEATLKEKRATIKLIDLADELAHTEIKKWNAKSEENIIALQGKNDFGNTGYDGPAPPAETGSHRYTFTIYALNKILDLKPGATEPELQKAIQGHILDKAQLIGIVEAPKKS